MFTEAEYNALLEENKRLRQELEKARASYTALSDYMSRTSHEIRTPMNSIIGLAEMGIEESYGRAVGGYFKQIEETARYQLEIVNDILDMARIESGVITLYPEAYSLEAFAENVNAVMLPLMQKKDIDFSFEFHDIFADTLIMDKLRVKQIFFNLLSNAAKFTPEKGRVEFVISQQAAAAGKIRTVFTVRDNGIGMSQEFLTRLFEPFTQERNAGNASVQGTGLGLSIAKSLTELMGGKMSVKSAPNEGSEFRVELELPSSENTGTQVASEGLGYDFSGKRALVADDHSINRILETKILKKAGFEAEAVSNGFECLKRFVASTVGYYDIILLDVQMPVMDGYEAAAKIRALDRTDAATVKLLALSANAYPEDVKRSLEKGMNAHTGKPVIPAVLLGTVAGLLNQKYTEENNDGT